VSERLGILGGAFDPIHLGHLILASEAKRQLDLHRVLFVPTFESAHQVKAIHTTFAHRCALARAAVNGYDDFVVSDIESRVSGKSYTANTLQLLKTIYRDSALFFIMGADSLEQFDTWHEPDKILELATVAVAHRPGYRPEMKGRAGKMVSIEMPQIDVSASDLRRRVCQNLPIRFMVPASVEEYIRREGLYRKQDA
jgi:nicotinate-nucleotide adenylyltransferase